MLSGEVISVDFERNVANLPVIEAGALATGTFGEELQTPRDAELHDPLMTEDTSAGLGKDFAPQEAMIPGPLTTGWDGGVQDFAPQETEASLDSDFYVLEAA